MMLRDEPARAAANGRELAKLYQVRHRPPRWHGRWSVPSRTTRPVGREGQSLEINKAPIGYQERQASRRAAIARSRHQAVVSGFEVTSRLPLANGADVNAFALKASKTALSSRVISSSKFGSSSLRRTAAGVWRRPKPWRYEGQQPLHVAA
ncbi:hypothetical protein LZ30DRAFT_766491 [Colletotrichum cereale]|nr:hypothetical protein LZ30DRAFT_766491 [Colletotrichum cereale]